MQHNINRFNSASSGMSIYNVDCIEKKKKPSSKWIILLLFFLEQRVQLMVLFPAAFIWLFNFKIYKKPKIKWQDI